MLLSLVLLLHLALGMVLPLAHGAAPVAGSPSVSATAQDARGEGQTGEHGHAHDERDCALCSSLHAPLALPRPQAALPADLRAWRDTPASSRARSTRPASPSRARAPPAA